MAFMNSLVLVMALLATSLGVHGVSLPTTARSLSGCGYQSTTGRETLYAGEDQQEVGFVDWTLSDAGVTVKYTITAECEPGTAHVELTESVLDPPIPGKFDCTIQGSGSSVAVVCGNEYLADLSCCSTKYLYTHLELTCGDEEETAFAGEEKCIGRRWCNYVKIDPPCDGCACDGKCLAKQTCPEGCDGDELFCPAYIEAGSCTKKVPCQNDCRDGEKFCPDIVAGSCTKVTCECGEVCPGAECPEKVQCPGCDESVTACSLDKCPLCSCPPCYEEARVDGVLTCQGNANDTCNPCAGEGDKFCESLGNLENKFKCCPPTSNCKKDAEGDKQGPLQQRLGSVAADRNVTFVCASNCGTGCDGTQDGLSIGCALFSPLILGADGDPDTDDIFNVCDGDDGLTVDTCPETGECTA